jgi:hypothetical protein
MFLNSTLPQYTEVNLNLDPTFLNLFQFYYIQFLIQIRDWILIFLNLTFYGAA